MNYAEISKETISHLYKSYTSLKQSPLNQSLRVLAELRVSQINGCAYCCGIHLEEARKLNIPQDKLDLLPVWREAKCFTDEERAAFDWCESLTHFEKHLETVKEKLFTYFNEREIVDLTACISVMNALNRLAVSLR
jgi:AhpD family alkylhydroperoxidase